jgi:membrane protease subunit HflK
MRDPEGSLHQSAQVAIRGVVGDTSTEDVLPTGRAQVQDDATGYIQALMDQYESCLLITEVRLQVVDPPDQVKDAFNEVVRAREDRERQRSEAQAYIEDIVPKARGEAEQVVRSVDAYRQQRVLQAQGDVARFRAVLEDYRKGKDRDPRAAVSRDDRAGARESEKGRGRLRGWRSNAAALAAERSRSQHWSDT